MPSSMRNVVALVLGGGQGTRLFPLTKIRSKPAVPLAGKYRLIDIPLSNCINSDVNRIYVLTQFMSVSLHSHIRQTYTFDAFSNGFVSLLAAQQTMDSGTDWYQGTADAVRKNLRYFKQADVEYVLILSGDQLYRMDFSEMMETHRNSGAEVSIAAMPVASDDASGLGVMQCDQSGRVTGFVEKPQTEEELATVRTSPEWIDSHNIESRGRDCLASMGIYLFNRDALVDLLSNNDHQDFGREVFPMAIQQRHVQMHLFDGYWEDIGTIGSFYEANIALTHDHPPFTFTRTGAPVFTRARFLPPTRIQGATVTRTLVADGCRIGANSIIENSVIGLRTIIEPDVTIRDSILMGADRYGARDENGDHHRSPEHPATGIGSGTIIEKAIVDKNCRIGRNVRIVNTAGVEETMDKDLYMIRDSIPVIPKGTTLPDGWTLPSDNT